MARTPDADEFGDESVPKLTFFQRIRYAMVQPDDDPSAAKVDEGPKTVPEIEAAIARADDKERAIGLVAAPVGAAIAFLIITALIDHDPPTLLSNGNINAAHVSVSLYHELLGVLIFMAVLMLLMAFLRKRLFLGIVIALFGLAVFNLHYWGFGVPFVMAGAWLLVRSYRLSQKLKLAGGGTPRPARGSSTNGTSKPRSNKRYTPPR